MVYFLIKVALKSIVICQMIRDCPENKNMSASHLLTGIFWVVKESSMNICRNARILVFGNRGRVLAGNRRRTMEIMYFMGGVLLVIIFAVVATVTTVATAAAAITMEEDEEED